MPPAKERKLTASSSKSSSSSSGRGRLATERILNDIIASGASPDRIAAAQKTAKPKKRGFFQGALGAIADSPVGKAVGGGLDALDTLRAGVVSGFGEGTDFLIDAFNLPGHEYVDASFSEFIKQTRDNVGFGTMWREKTAASAAGGDNDLFGLKLYKNPEVLANAPKGSKAFKKWLQEQEGGKKLKTTKGGSIASIAVGLTGDIGLDPLTYVTAGAAGAGKAGLRGLSSEAVADAAMKAGRKDIAQKAFTKGKWALDSKELEAIGLAGQGGLHLTLPGSGSRLGRAVTRADEVKQWQIPGTENLMRHTPVGVYQSIRAKTRTSMAESWVVRNLGGVMPDIKTKAFTGTPDEFAKAFAAIQGRNVAVGVAKQFDEVVGPQWGELERKLRKAGVDGETAYQALGDPDNVGPAAKAILAKEGGPQLLLELKQFAHEVLPREVNSHAVPFEVMESLPPEMRQLIQPRTGWQPAVRPRETKEYLAKLYGRGSGGGKYPLSKAGFELPAELVADGEFLGERLIPFTKGNESLITSKFGEFLNERQQAAKILERRMADLGEKNVLAMFEEDLFVAMPSIIRDMAHRVYGARFEVELLERGAAKTLAQVTADTRAIAHAAGLRAARERLAEMRLSALEVEAQAKGAKQALNELREAAAASGDAVAARAAKRGKTVRGLAREAQKQIGAHVAAAQAAVESAERLQRFLPQLTKAQQELIEHIDNLTLNTPEFEALAARIDDVRRELDVSAETIGRILRTRDNLLAKLHDAQAKVDARLGNAAKNKAIVDAYQTEINNLEDVLVNLKTARRALIGDEDAFVALQEDLAYFRDWGRQTEAAIVDVEDLIRLSTTADVMGQREQLMARLRNNYWRDFSEYADRPQALMSALLKVQREVNETLADKGRLFDEIMSTGDVSGLTDQIDEVAVRITNLANEAAQYGRDDVAEQYLQLREKLPIIDGAVLNNPANSEGLWHLAVPSKLDLTSDSVRRQFAADALQRGFGAEHGVGIRLSQTPATGVQSANVVVKATNPKVYADGMVDVAYDHRRFAEFGTDAPHSVRMMRNDMLENALRDGVIKASDFPKYKSQWGQVIKRLNEGASLHQAVYDSFGPRGGGRATIDMLGVRKRGWRSTYAVADDEWLTSQLADRLLGPNGELSADLKQSIGDAFRKRMAAKHDVIVLPTDIGEWQTIVLRPEVLHGPDGELLQGLVTYESAFRAAERTINEETDAIRAAIQATGADLDLAFGVHRGLQQKIVDSSARMDEIVAELEQARRQGVKQLAEKLNVEFSLRAEVDRLNAAALDHRKQAQRIRDGLGFVADQAGRANAQDAVRHQELLAQVAEAEAVSNLLEADLVRKQKSLSRTESKLDRLAGKLAKEMERNVEQTGDPFSKVIRNNVIPFKMRMISRNSYSDYWLADAIVDMSRAVGTPDGVRGVLGVVDRFHSYWKSQAMLRPGFHVRNYMGGVFNNWIAGVDSKSYEVFRARWKVFRKAEAAERGTGLLAVEKKFGIEDAQRMRDIVLHGVTTGGQSTETKAIGAVRASSKNPLSSDFVLFGANRRGMEAVENELRGAMAWDRLSKGLSVDAMLSDIARYHFDYDDLSHFERNTVRRIVPFYTWTRKNLPVQIEMFLENPKHVLRFLHAKRNIEMVSEEEDIYPSWFDRTLTVRMPVKAGENAVYAFPDLPFAAATDTLAGVVNPSSFLSDVTPLLKTPLEYRNNRQFFGDLPLKDGYVATPGIWDSIGITQMMALFGKAQRNANGEWMARDKDVYLVEQFMPVFGQARRLAPTEEKYQARQAYTYLSFLFGQTARANTAQDQESEMIRRQFALQEQRKDLESLGYVSPRRAREKS